MLVNPALPAITAKIMTLVDKVLSFFVETHWLIDPGAAGNCSIPTMYSNVTSCGTDLADMLAQTVYAISGLVGTMIAALGVNIQPAIS